MKTYMCFMVGNSVCICHKCMVSNVSFIYNKNLNGISIKDPKFSRNLYEKRLKLCDVMLCNAHSYPKR